MEDTADKARSAREQAMGTFAAARESLRGAPREGLGELVIPRLFAAARGPRIVPRGEAWRLGVLLLTEDGVLGTGEVVRALDPGRRGFTAQASRERAELGLAALRGGFATGQTVHVGWRAIDLSELDGEAASGPLAVRGGVVSVRWSATAGYLPLAQYVSERVDLLRSPPAGAS